MGGMKQDEQERVLQEFRDGTVQVLLATCIGEEGLDVPQVCVCVLAGCLLCQCDLAVSSCWRERRRVGAAAALLECRCTSCVCGAVRAPAQHASWQGGYLVRWPLCFIC